jgi:signal transduction histidine kinase/CheY-like chemotaxis protein
VLYCNPFLAALVDVPVESMLGAPLSGFLDERTAVSLGSLLQAAGSGVSRGDVSFRRGKGYVPTHVSITALPLEGVPVFCMIVTDLTESQRREEERAQLERERISRAAAEEANRIAQEEIERRKKIEASLRRAEKERTEILARERVARSEAEEASRLKDEFLATLSHELRSPLNAIVAWSHLLSDPDLNPAMVSRGVQVIGRNAKAQAQLVADILDVSRIITGKFPISLGPVRLSDVVESAADTLRPAARAREIQLELAIDTAAGPVSGDASRLQQVIWNLLSNALKFAPSGGRVRVQLEDAGSCIELTVTDDGPGIDPAFLPYVFDRFRQADSSRTRRHGGLGLGLAIVRHLVELHGGTVEARNREDQPGAVLIVRLPRLEGASAVALDEQTASANAEVRGAQSRTLLEDVSVLMVDDNADAREVMAMALECHGARVTTAGSASEAIDALAREHPQVLVSDIGMAGADGYALLQQVRALPAERGGATPAIALTGFVSNRDRADALRAGFQKHLSKPVTPAELAAAVASLVTRTRAAAPSS